MLFMFIYLHELCHLWHSEMRGQAWQDNTLLVNGEPQSVELIRTVLCGPKHMGVPPQLTGPSHIQTICSWGFPSDLVIYLLMIDDLKPCWSPIGVYRHRGGNSVQNEKIDHEYKCHWGHVLCTLLHLNMAQASMSNGWLAAGLLLFILYQQKREMPLWFACV